MSASAEDRLKYLLIVLKHTDLAQPNYQAIAKETGITSANNAQKKFKAYIEQSGFKFKDKQVCGTDDSNKPAKPASAPSTPTGKRGGITKPASLKKSVKKDAPKTATTISSASGERGAKKRGISEAVDVSDDEDQEIEAVRKEEEQEQDGGKASDGRTEDGYRSERGRSMTIKAEEAI